MFDDDIESVLPPHSTDFERALEQASLWVVKNSELVDVWNAQTAPERFLPWLAWSVSVDEWDATWPIEVKRAAILASQEIHRLKGTRGAVRRALEALGYEVVITEWFEEGGTGEPYTFCLEFDGENLAAQSVVLDQAFVDLITRQIGHVKSTRSHFKILAETQVADEIYVRHRASVISPWCNYHDFQRSV